MESVVSLFTGLLGVALAFYAKSAFDDTALFNRVRGFALSVLGSAAGFCVAWSAAAMASRSTVEAYWQTLPAGHWVDWGLLMDAVEGGSVSWWVICVAGVSAVLLHGLRMIADANQAVGLIARAQSPLLRSKPFLRSRGYALAGACAICASCIGWNIGVDKAHAVLFSHLQDPRTANWVDWFKVGSDITESAAPWWLMGCLGLAAVALHLLGLVADRERSGRDGNHAVSRIIIPTTYRSR